MSNPSPSPRTAAARGLATITYNGTVLDVWYPAVKVDEPVTDTATTRLEEAPQQFAHLVGPDEERGVARVPVHTSVADLNAAPTDAYEVYLRLHVLSHRLAQPGQVNISGARDILAKVVWTNYGPCAMEDFQMIRGRLAGNGPVTVYSVNAFPRMLDYVVPQGIDVLESGRVLLGAHLAEGTTVTESGFVLPGTGSVGPATIDRRLDPEEVLA